VRRIRARPPSEAPRRRRGRVVREVPVNQDAPTPRERLFVRHLTAGRPGVLGNATRAAQAAGVSPHNPASAGVWAARALGKARVRHAYEAVMAAADVSAAKTLHELASVGYSRPEGAPRHSDKVSALALLAKIQGLLRDRVEVSGPDGGPIEAVVLTPAERAKRITAILRAGGQLPAAPPAPEPPTPPTTAHVGNGGRPNG
jgi:hypothetical protein